MFDAVRDAALAIKASGRWDLVVEACAKCLSSVKKCDPKFVVSIGVKDDFPFRWMFPAKGFETMTPPQLKLLAKTRGDLFMMLRHALSVLAPKMTRQEYDRRLKEIVGKYGRSLQQSASILERARVAYADNADVAKKIEKAASICTSINNALLAAGPNLFLDTLVKQIEQVLVFTRTLLTTKSTKQRKRVRFNDDAEEETACRMLVEMSSK
jgi:hypothetical protein